MKTYFYLLSIYLFLFTACGDSSLDKSKQFDQLLEDFYQEKLELYRLDATYLGDTRYNDTLPNFLSKEFKVKENSFFKSYQIAVANFKDEDLSQAQQLSKVIFLWETNMQLDTRNVLSDLMPVDQMWSFHLRFGQLASGAGAQPFQTEQDYRNWLIRIDGFIEWLQSAEDNMREGIEKGVIMPSALIHKVLPQLKQMITSKAEDHLFYSPIKQIPDEFSEKLKSEFSDAFKTMILNKVIPAYTQLYSFMANEYLSYGRKSSGINALPGGEDYYQYAIKYYTTTDMSPEEIHQLGLEEVARIRGEMEEIKQQVGFKGELLAFFDHVRELDSLMPFIQPQQVIENFNAIHQRVIPKVNELFSLQPETPFEVRRTEAFREASASAEYNPGSLDGSRPGIFYVPIRNVRQYNIHQDEDLFLHEAIPGHHFQISLQQENKALPSFRKNLWYSAYGEGWALYTESLGKELNLYTDPYQYFGMLAAEMHRAIRLVVDTGIHAKGWSREKAIQYSLENESESEVKITSEIERYMANPGQALSYKIGQLKIRALRSKSQKKLGDKFDIREFHRIVLEDGCIPLALLEDKVDRWINNQN